jgi:proteasome lid subunit RPN8/RPN11
LLNAECDPYKNEDTKDTVSCENVFGESAKEVGTFHSHPDGSPISEEDKGFARTRGGGNPIYKGNPDGTVEKFTPDMTVSPSQDNLFPGTEKTVPTR